jgi:flagellar hook-length control protein FliK
MLSTKDGPVTRGPEASRDEPMTTAQDDPPSADAIANGRSRQRQASATARSLEARQDQGAATSLSPRAEAFIRALQQVHGPAEPRTDAALTAPAASADVAAASMAQSALTTERGLWSSAIANAAAAVASNDASRDDATRVLSDREQLSLRSQLSASVVSRLFDDTLSSTTSGRQESGHRESSYSGQRPHTLDLSKELASGGLFGAATPFEITSPSSIADVADGPVESNGRLPNESAVAASLVRSMQWQHRNGVGTAVVQLDPGYLGDVRIALRVDGNSVSATLHAANPEVRTWMHANEGALRQSLAGQGLSLDQLVIAEEDPAEHQAPPDQRDKREQGEERPRPRRARPQGDAGTFEIVV